MSELFLYRVMETDDDGDPLDHGVVRADDTNQLRELLEERFGNIGLFNIGDRIDVKVYPLINPKDTGIFGNESPFNMVIRQDSDAAAMAEAILTTGDECVECGETINGDGTASPHGSMHDNCALEHEKDNPSDW
jgi:hypothetical protein